MFVEPAKHRRSEARRVAMFVEGCLTTNMSALRAYGWFGILWLQTCRPYGPLNGGVWLVLQTCQPYGPLNGVFGWLQTCRPYGPLNGGVWLVLQTCRPCGPTNMATCGPANMTTLRAYKHGDPAGLQTWRPNIIFFCARFCPSHLCVRNWNKAC